MKTYFAKYWQNIKKKKKIITMRYDLDFKIICCFFFVFLCSLGYKAMKIIRMNCLLRLNVFCFCVWILIVKILRFWLLNWLLFVKGKTCFFFDYWKARNASNVCFSQFRIRTRTQMNSNDRKHSWLRDNYNGGGVFMIFFKKIYIWIFFVISHLSIKYQHKCESQTL